MVKKSLKDLPEPDIKKGTNQITRLRNDIKGDNKKKVRYLDEILDKSFLKEYFEQKD